MAPAARALGSLLALIQHKGPGVVIPRHGDNRLTLEGPHAGLVHRVAGDGGCRVAGPVESVPGSVIGQAFHGAHIYEKEGAAGLGWGQKAGLKGRPGQELRGSLSTPFLTHVEWEEMCGSWGAGGDTARGAPKPCGISLFPTQ